MNNYDIEYSIEALERLRIKLNSSDYSNSWFKRHFRGMLNELIRIKTEEVVEQK